MSRAIPSKPTACAPQLPKAAFCEPTEEDIAAARDRIKAREASGMVRMSDDVAMDGWRHLA